MPPIKFLGIISLLLILTLVISACSTTKNADDMSSEKPAVKIQSVSTEAKNNGTIKQVSAQEYTGSDIAGEGVKADRCQYPRGIS